MMNTESTKDKRVWHSGPPPFIGWWNASNALSKGIWRWWDGEYWSVVVRENDQLDTVAYYGGIADQLPGDLMWNDYWPEDAVCPRVDPASAEGICWEGRFWVWRDGELTSTSMGAESSKSCRVWHNGPPPHIGWWNASNAHVKTVWRWWDGRRWSVLACEGDQPDTVAYCASIPTEFRGEILWNDYWPENAVCPRFDPNGSLVAMWRGRVWEWVDGELVNQTEEFRNLFESLPSLKTIACPDHKFVDTKAIQTELQNISVELADIEDKVANIVYCIGRVRRHLS